MSLIAVAVYDTKENGRTPYTRRSLASLFNTIDPNEHRVVIVDNGSCDATKHYLSVKKQIVDFTLITNETNVGTANAINQAWRLREPGEHLVKMDNDMVIHQFGWADQLEEAIERDPQIGIIGLKRKDLGENPFLPQGHWLKSELHMLPHEPGQTWIITEKVNHVMGSVQMYNSALIDKIGGLYQMGGLYGFDDSLAAVRCKVAGFYSCFLPHVPIDHIDPGGTAYQDWKEKYSGALMDDYNKTKAGMIAGTIEINYPL